MVWLPPLESINICLVAGKKLANLLFSKDIDNTDGSFGDGGGNDLYDKSGTVFFVNMRL